MGAYEDLSVYQKSYKAALAIYELTKGYPESEKYGMIDQMRRSAVSIPLNIAEGYGKKSSKAEFVRFLLMAIGSSNEISVLISLSKDIGYIDERTYQRAKATYEEIGKMLTGLIKSQSNPST